MRKCKAMRYQIQQKARQNNVSISKDTHNCDIVAQGMITFGYRELVVKYSNRYQTFNIRESQLYKR